MSDKEIEQMIQSKGKIAKRITPEHIQNVIVEAHFVNALEAIASRTGYPKENYLNEHNGALATHTICILVLENGTIVTGESNCVSLENYDQEIGEKVAYAKAVEKIWALEGYLLKQKMYEDK